ncbi:MAG: autotransporter domain-containing protein, partial [Oscillospiraceae bacterium]
GANNVFYYVTSLAADGSVTLTQRGRFELTANNKSTPNITVENSQKVAVVSGADNFKYEDEAGTITDFKNVVVNGDLYLASNDGDTNKTYNVNNLSGTNAGASLIIGGSKGATLNLHNAGEMNTNFAGSIIGETGSTISKTGEGTLTVNGGISSTGNLEIKNGILSTTQVAIKGDVSISDKGTLNLTGTGDQAVSNMGELSINDGTINLGDGTYFYTVNVMGYMFFKNATFAGKGEICQGAGNKMDVFGTNNLGKTVKIKQEENSTLNLGTATVTTIGGLIGKGIVTATIDTSLTINTPLGDGEIYNYEGFLSGPNIVAGTVVGIIIKEGEGSQALSGTTDANNLYNLAVKEGNLILNSDKAIYAAITVQGEIKAGRAFTLANENATANTNANANANAIDPALKSGTLSIFKSTTGASLTVKNNGIVNVAQGQTLTLTGTSTFETGSTLTLNGLHSSNAAIIAKDFVGMDQLHVSINPMDLGWNTVLDVVVLQDSDKEAITNSLDIDKVTANGFHDLATSVTGTDKNQIVVTGLRDRTSSSIYSDYAQSANAQAGLDMIWQSNFDYAEKNHSELGSATLDPENKNLASLVNSMSYLTATGNKSAASHLMAAAAGSTVTSLLSSSRGDFRQQQLWMRNRVTQMGVNQNVVNEDMPYFNAWVQGNGGYTSLDNSGDKAGYDLNTWGGTAGFDVDINANVTIGAAFTASHGKLTSEGADTAKGHNDSYYTNLFARVQHKAWAHSLIVTGGWNDMNLDRTVSSATTGTNYTTNGTTSGSSIGAMYEATYDIALNEKKTSIFQPLLNLSYTTLKVDGYTETGAGSAGLDVESMKANYGTVALGARLMGLVGSNIFGRESLGELRVQVAQDFGDTDSEGKVAFKGSNNRQTVYGSKMGTTGVVFGAGLSVPVNQQGTIYVDANADVRSRATSVNGN